MKLVGDISLRLGKYVLRQEDLDRNIQGKRGITIAELGILPEPVRSIDLFITIHGKLVPLTIHADSQGGPLTFDMSLVVVPYQIEGKDGFANYDLRLCPLNGKVSQVCVDSDVQCSINSYAAFADRIEARFGNNQITVTIYFAAPDKKTAAE